MVSGFNLTHCSDSSCLENVVYISSIGWKTAVYFQERRKTSREALMMLP